MGNINENHIPSVIDAIPNEVQKTAEQPVELTIEEKREKARIRLTQTIEEPPAVLHIICNEQKRIFGTQKNFSLIIGKPKSRKTYFVSLLLSSFFHEGPLMDKITASLPKNKNHIIYFDTEQADFHVQRVLRRIVETAGLSEEPENISVYSLRPNSISERVAIIRNALEKEPDIAVVVIDGIRDLVTDINSAEEATGIVDLLMKWTHELQIHIITVLHQNKNDNNARGHLGTELINKAESVLSVTRDGGDENCSIVKPEHLRDKEFKAFAFMIDKRELPFIKNEWESSAKSTTQSKALTPNQIDDSLHLNALKEIFSKAEKLQYSELLRRVIESMTIENKKIGKNKAGKFLTYYQDKGWIAKNDNKLSNQKYTTYHFNAPL